MKELQSCSQALEKAWPQSWSRRVKLTSSSQLKCVQGMGANRRHAEHLLLGREGIMLPDRIQ